MQIMPGDRVDALAQGTIKVSARKVRGSDSGKKLPTRNKESGGMSSTQDSREATMIGRRSDGTLIRRPLSPHLQAYDMLQMTSALSISHRISGVVWVAGVLVMTWWLVAAATGPAAFGAVQWFLGSFVGILLLMGVTAAAWFHTLAGIRHLAWDAGWGFDIPTVYKTGRAVLIGTGVLTALTWLALLISW
jgi:succinate dehydrogenase / fumarate reductase cytochrome b subunit